MRKSKMDELTPVTAAERALAIAQTPEESRQVESLSSAAIAWAKEQDDYSLLLQAARIYFLSRRKTTELIEPNIKHGGDYTSVDWEQGNNNVTLLDYGFTKMQWSRRKKELQIELRKIDTYLNSCQNENVEPTIAGLLRWANVGVLQSKDKEWWTPREYIDAVHEVMGGIDLDPASCYEANEIVGASKFYTEDDDGLLMPWFGRIFLNPPYGNAGPDFAEKLYNEFGSTVSEAIMLVNSRATDAGWFQPCFEGVVCFTDHRIDFESPNEKQTSSTHGSCFVYFGAHEKKFSETFSRFGNIVKRWP